LAPNSDEKPTGESRESNAENADADQLRQPDTGADGAVVPIGKNHLDDRFGPSGEFNFRHRDNSSGTKWVQAYAAGTMLIACILVGFGLGYVADVQFHSDPWGKMIGTFMGIAAGFTELVRVLIRLSK
jgi:hypothetical protein